MSQQRKTTTEKVHLDMYQLYGPISGAIEFLTELNEKHKDKANVQLDYVFIDDDRKLILTYEREETDVEFEYRLKQEAQSKESRRKRYEELKKEFEK